MRPKYLCKRLQHVVRVALPLRSRALNLSHALQVDAEVAFEGCIHGRVVNWDQVLDGRGRVEGDAHGGFGAHRVPDDGWVFDRVFGEEGAYVGSEERVRVCLAVGGVAMVAEVL